MGNFVIFIHIKHIYYNTKIEETIKVLLSLFSLNHQNSSHAPAHAPNYARQKYRLRKVNRFTTDIINAFANNSTFTT